MMTMSSDEPADGPVLQEAMRELESAIHDARVAYDCIGLGDLDRAHTSAVTARIAIDAAMIAVQTELAGPGSQPGALVLRRPATAFGQAPG
jgi:hypothetical protein